MVCDEVLPSRINTWSGSNQLSKPDHLSGRVRRKTTWGTLSP